MQVKTRVKAGGREANHNETLVRASGQPLGAGLGRPPVAQGTSGCGEATGKGASYFLRESFVRFVCQRCSSAYSGDR